MASPAPAPAPTQAQGPAEAHADVLKVSILGKDSIHCGFHLTPYIVHTVLTTLPSSTYVLITDTNVANFHLDAFEGEFNAQIDKLDAKDKAKARFLSLVVAPGETIKSREGKAYIEDFLLANKCTRDTVILALGGGVIGDLVGFVAATFMRGVRFIQIPTSLLAMVDSSVGGKTAIDTPHGKNLIGAFWQPEYIFIDAAFLETLPPREFSNGMAEVVKTAAIWDEQEFTSLESRSAEIFAAIQSPSANFSGRLSRTRTPAQTLLLSIIAASISVKAHIVTIDERETGLRNLVNFGHTIGHAIEAVLTPTILHGECVAVGMVLEAEVARALGVLSQVAVGRLTRALKGYNLPVSLGDPRIAGLPEAKGLTVDRLLDIMKIDKKNSGDEKKIVLLSRIGATLEQKATAVRDEVIAKVLCEAARVVSGTPAKNPVKMTTPGSKSISNRVLVLAALGKGTCRLKNLLHSDDTQVMMAALHELKGAKFSWEDAGETLVVEGGEGILHLPPKGKELYLGNAGTAARFLTTVCTLVQPPPPPSPSTPPGSLPTHTVITGNARMKQRPIGPLVTALQANGAPIAYLGTPGCLPLSIPPGGLKGGHIRLAASVSSQYVSSILLCAPYAREGVTLELVGGEVISQPYIDMTVSMMRSFGVEVRRRKEESTGKWLDVYDIPKGGYVNPPEYNIESDASSATYPLAIAAITGTTCTIQNIGSASLQGDAKFAKEVLEKMGCVVVQSETETTVTGPDPKAGGLKGIEEVDMEEMTDAFLTASVLAAVARGKTRITGIANQRVKECNRIRAMIDELAKFGVDTVELDDGLEIIGKPLAELKQGVSVHCYDDHRVAMAFSVLGAVVPGTIIEEKRCVEKTWPNWWDDLENKIGLKVEGVQLEPQTSEASASASHTEAPQKHEPSPSVILIGMRGTGKTTVGNMAATALSWPCIDADAFFEQKHQTPVREFVLKNGWAAFREAEVDVLKELIREKPKGHILSLGGGVVESPEAREVLKAYAKEGGPVVHIVRPLEDVIAYLDAETSRPAYDESVGDVFRRREPWFEECANYVFDNTFDAEGGVEGSEVSTRSAGTGTFGEVRRFFGHVTGERPNLAENMESNDKTGSRSYFLSLTYPDVRQAYPHIEALTEGVDALELRVDLLKSPRDYEKFGDGIPSKAYVQQQVSALRRVSSLPIVFTVRTKAQGGAFPDDKPKEAVELLKLALQMGVEYVDVELGLGEKDVKELKERKGHSKIIASWHDWSGGMKWDGREVREKYDLASRVGDVVKIVGKAGGIRDNFALYDFVEGVKKQGNNTNSKKPIIAINMGIEGQMSRVLNSTFSPVSHPLLPNKAAPGQLSFKQIQQALHLIGLLPSRTFYLFGNPIQQSMSPTLHNTAFEILGLPHKYELLETREVGEEIKLAITAPDFGGASVTIPFKLDVIPLLDRLTPAAEAIGAVNTIVPQAGSVLVGDNTDWIGIRNVINNKLGSRLGPGSGSGHGAIHAALVIGAGGTARAAIYALQALKADVIYLYNRTRSKAEELASLFPDANVKVIGQLADWAGQGIAPPSVIVSTVPASATTTEDEEAEHGAGAGAIVLSRALFEYHLGWGVVVDMAYRPAETPLIRLAKGVGRHWKVVPGLEVLLEQGYEQFRLWTGRTCPKGLVARKVWDRYNAV